MCGIAGYIGKSVIDDARVARALSLMGRRGPDHAGSEHVVNAAGRHVYLLHSRLSIIDLDPRSNQPFHAASQRIAYNGELYNYVEVRAELEKLGVVFQTTSDTEVMAQALARWGRDALDRCEGMWAFAACDDRDGSVLLSRDRFGEKPLYVYRDDSGVYFGSEVKFLSALAGKRFAVDVDHVKRYLVNGYKALYKQPHAFFQGVSELPPASALRIDANGSEQIAAYWKPRVDIDDGMTREQAVSATRERLIRSVELRLRADVPLAFCMSGGVDSNALISIAKRELGYDVHGFTIMNTDARYEESDLVNQSVSELGLRHTPVVPSTADFLPRLRELVRYHDAPVYTITYYAHWLLMEAIAKAGYRISVSGTAADELFSGYYDHHLLYFHAVQNDPALHAASLAAWEKHVKPGVRNPHLSNPRLFIDNPGFRDHAYMDADKFSECLTKPWMEDFEETAFPGAGLMQTRMLNELFHEAVPVILHEDDLNARYFSIENRSPFLDRRLFDTAFTIPPRHLVRDGAAKSVLRDAMRGIVPDAVLDSRRKVGFNAPIHAFLDPKDPAVRAEVLGPSPIWDIVRREAVLPLLAEDFLPNSQSKFLFYFLCSKMFLEECGA